MIHYWKKLLNIVKEKKTKQVFSLYSSTILGMVLGVGISVINTRLLGPEAYGDFKFLIHIFNFVVMFLTVGIFFSGSRLLTNDKNKEKAPGIKGAMMIYGAVMSLLMIIGFFIFSFFQDQIYNNNLGAVMRLFSPLLFLFPLRLCLEGIMIGSNQIYKLSLFRLLPKVLYLIFALVINWLFDFTLHSALLIHFSALIIIVIIIAILLKPKFEKLKEHWQFIKKENKSYGFPVYISHIANTATMRVAALSIAFFIDNTNVGYYALAITVSQPLAMIPRVVGTTFFKNFANREYIPLKATIATIGLGIIALTVFLLLIKTLFLYIYTKDFSPALRIVYFFAVASLIHGFADYINRFLGAHGRGRDMLNSAFLVAACNIIGYTVLIKYLSIDGVIITRVIASSLYLITMVYFYKKMPRNSYKKVNTNKIERGL